MIGGSGNNRGFNSDLSRALEKGRCEHGGKTWEAQLRSKVGDCEGLRNVAAWEAKLGAKAGTNSGHFETLDEATGLEPTCVSMQALVNDRGSPCPRRHATRYDAIHNGFY